MVFRGIGLFERCWDMGSVAGVIGRYQNSRRRPSVAVRTHLGTSDYTPHLAERTFY